VTEDRNGYAGRGGFGLSELTTAEVDELESYLVPLADSVRELLDATIRTSVSRTEVERATAEIDAVTARLRESVDSGASGVHFNAEGRSWQGGNAVVGRRNAAAPQMDVHVAPDGRTTAELTLRAAQEGPPGKMHGGVGALLLDHFMGVTASSMRRPSMTGTLTLRYVRGTALGPIRLDGWVERHEGYKTIVMATISDAEGVTVEAEGVFVMPRWARDLFPMPSATPTTEGDRA
jgi:acyl-coenzyme A thioesterase PaaI-like protein